MKGEVAVRNECLLRLALAMGPLHFTFGTEIGAKAWAADTRVKLSNAKDLMAKKGCLCCQPMHVEEANVKLTDHIRQPLDVPPRIFGTMESLLLHRGWILDSFVELLLLLNKSELYSKKCVSVCA
jgi:hypothetical protein